MIIRGSKKQKFASASVNVAFAGNSYIAGFGLSAPDKYIPAQMSNMWPLSGSGITVNNIGQGGYTWRMMNGLDGGTQIADAAWVNGKTNILLAMETVNSVQSAHLNAADTATATKDYITARLAVHPWKIIIVGPIPVNTYGYTYNDTFVTYNGILSANYRAWGVAAYVDPTAAGSPYCLPDFSAASLTNLLAPWLYDAIHPNDAGAAKLAGMASLALARLAA